MFYLFRKQEGAGCDYSLACGQKLEPIPGETLEDAGLEVAAILADYSLYDLKELGEVTILEVAHTVPVDLKELIAEKEMEEKAGLLEAKRRRLESARAEVEALEKELGKL
jgi:hypothetical protein